MGIGEVGGPMRAFLDLLRKSGSPGNCVIYEEKVKLTIVFWLFIA